ncbi:MAG: hypothetical protein GX425_09565, partial [Peptococcaceae bacterium]|nr:hypothetical protein [Peptococcaceae bacterium]
MNNNTRLGAKLVTAFCAVITTLVAAVLTVYFTHSPIVLAVAIVLGCLLPLLVGYYLKQSITGSINNLVTECGRLTEGAREGRLDIRGDVSKVDSEFQGIIEGFNNTLDAVVGPLNVAAEYIDRISKGDIPPKISDSYKGDFNEIKNNVNGCIDAVNGLLKEVESLILAVEEGRLDARGNTAAFTGDWGKLVGGMNGLIEAVAAPVNELMAVSGRLAVNDFSQRMVSEYTGTWNDIKNSTNAVHGQMARIQEILDNISRGSLVDLDGLKKVGQRSENDHLIPSFIKAMEAIHNLVTDADMLAKTAMEGKLDARADVSRHEGEYRKVIEGFNNTLDAVIGPLNVAAEYIDRISKGDIPPRITESYNGDFNEIKNNVNGCIDAVNGLLKEVDSLILAVREGRLDARGDAAAFTGDWSELVTGMNGLMEAVSEPVDELTGILRQYAVNDLSRKMDKDYSGIWNDLKHATNEVYGRMTNIRNTVIKVSKGDLSDAEPYKKVGRRSENDEIVPGFIRMHDAIQKLLDDANMLAGSAVAGKLDTRADATRHDGEYRNVIEGFNNTLDAVVGPLNVAAEYIDRISKGDIPPKITDSYSGDFNEIKNNVNGCIDAVNGLLKEVESLILAVEEGRLDARGDTAAYTGDWGKLVDGMNGLIDAVAGPVGELMGVSSRLAVNDFSQRMVSEYTGTWNDLKNSTNAVHGQMARIQEILANISRGSLVDLAGLKKVGQRSENDQLIPAFIKAMEAINNLVTDADMLARTAMEGKLDTRADVGKHEGEYRKVIEGFNNTLDAVIGPLNVAAEYIDRISKGDIPPRITDSYNGDFNEIKNNVNGCIDAVNGLLKEVDGLILAVREGRLDARGDAAAFAGDWGKLVVGMNGLMEAVAEPVEELIAVLGRMSVNDLSMKMEKNYAGNWDELKQAINGVHARLTNIYRTVNKVAKGDLTDYEFYSKVGRRSEKDDLVPGFIRM